MPEFATPEQAARGFLHLVQDRRNRAAARELPTSAVLTVAPDSDAVRGVFATMRRAGRLAAMQDEALAVLCAYGIPGVPTRAVASAEDAAAAAALLGLPAVVKLRQSVRPDARASGGLALDLHDVAEVAAAARLIAARRPASAAGAAPGGPLARTADPGGGRRHVRADHQLRPGRHDGGHRARRLGRSAAAQSGAGAWADRPHARRRDAGAVPRQSAGATSPPWRRRWCGSASSSSISPRSPNWTSTR